MSKETLSEIKRLLKSIKLSSYEIKAYLTLLRFNELSARDLSQQSNIPIGRIYEVLTQLSDKTMIQIIPSHPKFYKAFKFTTAISNLISYLDNIHNKKTEILKNEADVLEARLHHLSEIKKNIGEIEPFWTTVYGYQSIFSMYLRYFFDLKEELLLYYFIDKNTPKIMTRGINLFKGILEVAERGINVKILWTTQHDERPLKAEELDHDKALYFKIVNKFYELMNLSKDSSLIKMKFYSARMTTLFDILDGKRVLLKVQDPLNPSRILSCISLNDPLLAKNLRDKYLNIWTFEYMDI